MKYDKPGIFKGMPESHYFGDETVEWLNRSKIVKVEQYSGKELTSTDSSMSTAPALRMGSALHQLWLEDKKEWDVTKFGSRTKAGKEAFTKAAEEGKLLLQDKEEALVLEWFKVLEENKACKEIRDNLSDSELTILDGDYNGLQAKIRIDGVSSDGYLIDLKTTAAVCTASSLKETIEKWGYLYQRVMYFDIAKKFMPELKGFKFVFISKPTLKAAVVTVERADLETLREEMRVKCEIAKSKLDNYKNGKEEEPTEMEIY